MSATRHRRARRSAAAAAVGITALSSLLVAAPAHAGGNPWSPAGPVSGPAALTNGGPWVATQAGATYANPLAGYCPTDGGAPADHTTGTNIMQPFYFPFVQSNDGRGHLTGLFDWRPKDNNESVVQATSNDGGATWTADDRGHLRYRATCQTTNTGDDNGQGHPFLLNVGGAPHLYTLDRQTGAVDSSGVGLLVHTATASADGGSIAGLPGDEPLAGATVPATAAHTTGLVNPDGILGQVPDRPGTASTGAADAGAATILYIEKDKSYFSSNETGSACTATDPGSDKTVNQDRTVVRAARTTNGVDFTDLGVVGGLNNPNDTSRTGTRFVAPQGTIVRYADGTLGLFFAGGNCYDGDSDAYHYIGYAHTDSPNPLTWSVDRGYGNPFVSVDFTYPQDKPRSYYTGRTYSPQVVLSRDLTRATLLFSGYQYPKPTTVAKTVASDGTGRTAQPVSYRAILALPLVVSTQAPSGLPEAPLALLLPLTAVATGAAIALRTRRRRRAA